MNLMTWLRAEWDRVAGFGLVGLGGLFLLLGYYGVKGTPFLAEQLAYIASGGLGGIFCMGLGVGLLLSADLHDEWRKLDRIEAAMRGQPVPAAADVLDQLRSNGAAAVPDPEPTPRGRGRRATATAAVTVDLATGTRVAGPGGPLALALDWRGDGLRRAILLAGLAVLAPLSLMAAGWHKAARTADLDTAAKGVGIAFLGLAVAVAVVGLYTLWLRWRLTGREARLFGTYVLEDLLAEQRRHQPHPPVKAHGKPADAEVIVAAGLHRFHRAGCPMTAGFDAAPMPRRDVDPGLTACAICGAE